MDYTCKESDMTEWLSFTHSLTHSNDFMREREILIHEWIDILSSFLWNVWCVSEWVKVTQSCPTLQPHGLYIPWDSPGQNTRMGSLFLLQQIFPTQGSNSGLLHWGRILYQLSDKGSPRMLRWAFPSQADLPNPGIEPGSSALQVDSSPIELSGKPITQCYVVT